MNKEKCEFAKEKVLFLGHIIGKEGISPDPSKVSAVRDMEAPTNVKELRRFMGMANYLGKFSPNLAKFSQPLRELLGTKASGYGEHQKKRHSRKSRKS